MRKKVVIVDHREEGFELEKKAFASEDAELMIYQCRDEDELIEAVSDACVIIFTSSNTLCSGLRSICSASCT